MEIITLSENAKSEYCATVVRIGELKPIENSDFLCQTIVDGFSMVVRKNEVKEGDLMVYCSNETQLNKQFLSVNNLFELSSRELNANHAEVEQLLADGKNDEAKAKVGFFNKHGRVKMIRLRGCPSMGFLVCQSTIAHWKPQFGQVNLEDYVGKDFDTIDGELFIKAYVPQVRVKGSLSKKNKTDKNARLFDRLVEGEFHFHYDTDPLNKNIQLLKPTDKVTISVKQHGTSIILAKVLVKKPHTLHTRIGWLNRAFNKVYSLLPTKLQRFDEVYGDVYSSRTVIKNQFVNTANPVSLYDYDIWTEYNDLLKDYIPEGMTLYGEICGYITGTQQMVQKDYDYGCAEGENAMMVYRITTKEGDRLKEWNVMEVKEWTERFVADHPELASRVRPINVLYHGLLQDLYADLVVDDQWNANLLERMKADGKVLGMEKNEPMCNNKVPREGVCLRIDDDVVTECFKLKSIKFLEKERSLIDKGEVDIEMGSAYGA